GEATRRRGDAPGRRVGCVDATAWPAARLHPCRVRPRPVLAGLQRSRDSEVCFAVARQIDWDQVAVAILGAAYDNIAVPATPGRLTVAEVAADYDLDPRELYRSVRRQLEHTLLTDTSLPRELRRALLRLAQAHLGSGDVYPAEAH